MIIAAALLLFIAVGGYLIFGHQQRPVEARTFKLTVAGNSMSPGHLLAYEGDTLTITVSTDKAEEIPLHGYDKHFDAAPDKPVTQTFKADKTGSFDIEIEATGTPVGSLEVDPR